MMKTPGLSCAGGQSGRKQRSIFVGTSWPFKQVGTVAQIIIHIYDSLQRKVCELVMSLHKGVGKIDLLASLGTKLREPLYTNVLWLWGYVNISEMNS